MKVFILVDMEGISGICLEQHTSADNPHYERARRWMTQDVNAAVQGAIDGGAKEIVVLDGHGANSLYNLVYEDLHEDAEYIVGSPRGWYLTGIDESFDCMLMVGKHAMSGTPNAVLEHTWSGASWYRCRLNGVETGEIGLMAAFAGTFKVPVTMVSGDKAACEEAKRFLGDHIAVACVKEGLSRYAAKMLSPAVARRKIQEAAAEGVRNAKNGKPCIVETPVKLEIDYMRLSSVDSIREAEGVKFTGPRTVCYSGKDVPSACYLMR